MLLEYRQSLLIYFYFFDQTLMKKTITLFSLLGGLFAVTPVQAAYQLFDLSAYLDASNNYAFSSALNDNNGATGVDSSFNATYWTGSAAQNLSTLGGSSGMAFGVNNINQVVGWSNLAGNTNWHATLWNNSTSPTDLGTLGGSNSEAFAINNSGNAVGWSHNTSGDSRATLWSGSNIIDLGAINGSTESEAYGINASNQIVGLSIIGSTRYATAWSYDGSNVTVTDLGFGEAYAINDSGTIIGISGNNAVRWDGSTSSTLDTLGSTSNAYDINNAGIIVGNSRVGNTYHGALWSGTTVTDINSLLEQSVIDDGWFISDAFSINDNGNILAYAEDAQGNEKTVLLFTASTTAVPETDLSLMIVVGLCLIGFKRRRFKQLV